MENTFLPKDYEKPSTANQYMKLEEGDNKIRVLAPAITGWIDWTPDKKPVRSKTEPETNFNPDNPAKHFWAFPVWDYRDEKVKILEITQSSIQGSLLGFVNDEDWGDPIKYDVNIKRSGKDMGTKYTVVTTPPKEPSAQIKDAIKHMTVNMEALFDGGDPFKVDTPKIDVEAEEKTMDNTPPFEDNPLENM